MATQRNYDEVVRTLRSKGDKPERMQQVVDAIWAAHASSGVSWVGFYLDQPGEPDDRRLILGPRRDKPACSPIGLHGVCGQSLLRREPIVVPDVSLLGDGYIPCDPRDRSEVVVPVVDDSGVCWAVLDLDSHEVEGFDDADVIGLQRMLHASGLDRWGARGVKSGQATEARS